MRILFIGCSWTDFRVDNHESYGPYKEFAKYYSGRIDVISHGGTSIDMHYDLLKEINLDIYDFIIFQITAAQRGFYRKENFKKLEESDFVTEDNKIYEIRNYLENNYEWYNPGWYQRLSKENWRKVKLKILRHPDCVEFEKEWLEYVNKVQQYLEENKKKYIMYHHVLDHLEDKDIIKEARKFEVVQDWLGDNFKLFCLDKGHHLNQKGNKQVATKLYSLFEQLTS